jgi:hypothetical protein
MSETPPPAAQDLERALLLSLIDIHLRRVSTDALEALEGDLRAGQPSTALRLVTFYAFPEGALQVPAHDESPFAAVRLQTAAKRFKKMENGDGGHLEDAARPPLRLRHRAGSPHRAGPPRPLGRP